VPLLSDLESAITQEMKETNPMTTPVDEPTSTTTWEIDPTASKAEFSARMRLMFLTSITVVGVFPEVHGTVTGTQSDPTNAQVSVTIGAASLDTKSPPRDKHLRSADFFDVEHYPELTFISRRIEAIDPAHGRYRVTGSLTIRDMTRDVSLDAQYMPEAGAAQRPAVDLETRLDRRDFGLIWSRPVQKIADDVKITLHIECIPASSPA
jgi:polyisoprenoid-binding protein YceI